MPPRNYFGMFVEDVQFDGIVHEHSKLHSALLSGAVELEIETLSPVHVGSGAYNLVGDQVVKDLVYRDGIPIIPGSSIKGMCRQIHEVLTRSTSPFDRDQLSETKRPSASAGIFGRRGFAGLISFDDAVPVKPHELVEVQPVDLSVPYEPRKRVGRRFYGPMPPDADQPGRIRVLTIPSGTKLETCLRFRNLQHYELGGVLLSLGVDQFTPKIGGGKYDSLGWVEFRISRYRLRTGKVPSQEPSHQDQSDCEMKHSVLSYREGWVEDTERVKALYEPHLASENLPSMDGTALKKLTDELQASPLEIGGES